ncbi:hypothetical protein GCM10023195_51380 [Actinoallomurus liliacearum]|uniref:DUF4345 domain-containing protein n=1 Tax=Actinoallomurus liliacearum TaxID=1080073 RepID=A0ABP8TQA5_9ACTN
MACPGPSHNVAQQLSGSAAAAWNVTLGLWFVSDYEEHVLTTVTIVIVGIFFLGMGALALIAPAELARPFRITIDSPESRSEIRAVYGGFGVAIAIVLGLAAFDVVGIRSGAVITVAAALTGMAAGRLISRLIDSATAFYPIWLYFCVETVAAGLLFNAT